MTDIRKISTPFLLAHGIEAAEFNMKSVMTELLYGGPQAERRTPEQIAREPGYYWCKFQDKWGVEEWTGREWLMHGVDESISEDVGLIGPRIEPPEDDAPV